VRRLALWVGAAVVFKKAGRSISWIVEACGAFIAAIGLLLLYLSLLARLQSGEWPVSDLKMLCDNARAQWPTLQLITKLQNAVDSAPTIILNAPAWAPFIIAGGVIYILGLVGVKKFDESILKHHNAG
jgi:hypothetical protein